MPEEEKTESKTAIGPNLIEELKKNPLYLERVAEAYKRFFTGKTPAEEGNRQIIKERPGRGGKKQRYVDVGYMTEQANLVFGFAWTEEILKEEERKDKDGKITEIGALVKVSITLSDGRVISKIQWGQKDIGRYEKDVVDRRTGVVKFKAGDIIAFYDDRKAAISDGVKKCLSYFGIAADVYAGKELELYEEAEAEEGEAEKEEKGGSTELTDLSKDQARFLKFLKSTGLTPSEVFKILKVKDLNAIKDYKAAEQKLAKALNQPEDKEVTPETK